MTTTTYWSWFALDATSQFTRWYFGPIRRRHRSVWAFGCWPLLVFILFCVFAYYFIASGIWLAVVTAIWVTQLLATLGQLAWWPIYAWKRRNASDF
jgi:hypothetical protein